MCLPVELKREVGVGCTPGGQQHPRVVEAIRVRSFKDGKGEEGDRQNNGAILLKRR